MMGLVDLLILGDPRLYEKCEPVRKDELDMISSWIEDLHNVMQEIRDKYSFGRGIAAPQLGIMKRLVYINIDQPLIIINPTFTFQSDDKFELWDDCMSFPHLLVKVARHSKVSITYRDENWNECNLDASGGLSELLQHEIDHLNGILCIDRAITKRSFKWRP